MPGFLGLLTLLFIGLKLTAHITWSWWLVLLPLYGGLGIFFLFFLFAFAIALITGAKPKYKLKF